MELDVAFDRDEVVRLPLLAMHDAERLVCSSVSSEYAQVHYFLPSRPEGLACQAPTGRFRTGGPRVELVLDRNILGDVQRTRIPKR